MKCRRAKTLIFDFIDGAIDDRNRLALEQHLGECKSCEMMASGLSKSLDILHRLPPEQPDENFTWKVRLRLARERSAVPDSTTVERTWLRSWNRRFVMSALSAFVVVVVSAYFVAQSTMVPDGGRFSFERQSNTPMVAEEQIASPVAKKESGPRVKLDDRGPSTLVSGGATQDRAEGGYSPLESPPVLDTDSLLTHYRKTMATWQRVRSLEEQVDYLTVQLRDCKQDK